MDVPELEHQLETRPSSFLSILEIEEKDEHSWNRLLYYFISPNRSPFDTKLLEIFIENFEDTGVETSFENIGEAKVYREVDINVDEYTADLIIKSQDWFVWIELKVGSGEGEEQTNNYISTSYVGHGETKSEYDAHEYVYIAPVENRPSSDEFHHINWEELIEWFDLGSDNPDICEQQLNIFRHAIEHALGLNNTMTTNKTEEYLRVWEENRETLRKLEELGDSFDTFLQGYAENKKSGIDPWWRPFLRDPPSRWGEDWNVYMQNEYGWIYLDNWEVEGHIPFHLEHLPKNKHYYKNGQLKLRLDCEKQKVLPLDVKNSIINRVRNDSELKKTAEQVGICILSTRSQLFTKTYDFEGGNNLVPNRTEALEKGFNEFEPIARRLDEIIQEEWFHSEQS